MNCFAFITFFLKTAGIDNLLQRYFKRGFFLQGISFGQILTTIQCQFFVVNLFTQYKKSMVNSLPRLKCLLIRIFIFIQNILEIFLFHEIPTKHKQYLLNTYTHSFISKYITGVRILNYLFGEDLFTLELRSNYKNSHFFTYALHISDHNLFDHLYYQLIVSYYNQRHHSKEIEIQ